MVLACSHAASQCQGAIELRWKKEKETRCQITDYALVFQTFLFLYICTFSFCNWKTYLGEFCICCTFLFFRIFFLLLLSVYKSIALLFLFLGDLCCLCHMFCFEFSLNVHPFGRFSDLEEHSLQVSKCTEPELPRGSWASGKTNMEVNSQFLP